MQLVQAAGALTYETLGIINSNFALSGIVTQGRQIWVKPRTGNAFGDGLTAQSAVRTLAQALAIATPGQNDVVLLCAESNTASQTSDYQSTTLNWNKDLVHLIGINDGPMFGQRSRVAFLSTYDTASNLITVSANGCLIAGIEFYAGVAGTNPTGCMKVTGQRNHFVNCQIAGMGNTANDIAGAYSLLIDAGAENLFERCVIGQDTTTLGANVNSVMYFATGATRNYFRGCLFPLYTAHATNTQFLRAPAGSMDRSQYFENCTFDNAIDSGSTALTQAMTVAASGSPAGGLRFIGNTVVFGATDVNATDAGNVRAGVFQSTTTTAALPVVVTR